MFCVIVLVLLLQIQSWACMLLFCILRSRLCLHFIKGFLLSLYSSVEMNASVFHIAVGAEVRMQLSDCTKLLIRSEIKMEINKSETQDDWLHNRNQLIFLRQYFPQTMTCYGQTTGSQVGTHQVV